MTSRIVSLSITALLLLSAFVSIGAIASASAATTATLTLSATSGPSGSYVTLTGSGFTSGTIYNLWLDSASGTPLYPVWAFTATSSGAPPAAGAFGSRLTVPSVASGSYYLEAFSGVDATLVASDSFTVTASSATVSPSATSGAPGAVVTLTGSGYTGDQPYYVYVDTTSGTPLWWVGWYLSTPTGAIPSGTAITVPAATGNPVVIPAIGAGSYYIDVFYQNTVVSSTAFTVT